MFVSYRFLNYVLITNTISLPAEYTPVVVGKLDPVCIISRSDKTCLAINTPVLLLFCRTFACL